MVVRIFNLCHKFCFLLLICTKNHMRKFWCPAWPMRVKPSWTPLVLVKEKPQNICLIFLLCENTARGSSRNFKVHMDTNTQSINILPWRLGRSSLGPKPLILYFCNGLFKTFTRHYLMFREIHYSLGSSCLNPVEPFQYLWYLFFFTILTVKRSL